VIERETNKTLKEYPVIEAQDWYYARHIAADLFLKETGMQYGWYVDSLEL
jgi:hypothetical protein